MAFRSADQDYRWSQPGHRPDRQPELERGDDAADSLSLEDTLRELAVTISGFVGVILLIIAVIHFAP
jgi:hypothetical protein